ncbi:MAG: signal recognition particle protein [Bacteroidetes bacterium]|nr:signal recognition particle protein [Bacteroidota bacterium]
MFENLSTKLDRAIKTLKGTATITEINVAQTVKEIRRALVEADVNYKVAKSVSDAIREKALGQEVLIAVSPGELLVKIVNDQLTELMGTTMQDINLKGNPAVVLIAGLQGSGKTTFAAKLANHLKKQGRQILLVACDIHRPAAIKQLNILGEQVDVEVYSEPDSKDAVKIAKNAVKYAKANSKKVVVIDTAGRLAIDEKMMREITQIKKATDPAETLFVVDAMTGQDAVNTAKTFNEKLNFDGVVLTKLDGDSRGGAALSIRAVVEKPIKFISHGEKPDTIDVFHPDRMANRILGMGDVVSFVEKTQDVFDEEEARILSKKIYKNQFNFEDMLSQLQQIKKMGNVKDLIGMLPGMDKIKDTKIDEDALKPMESIIRSMTVAERQMPDIINGSRRKRIASGSGTTVQQINNLLKQFQGMKKMLKAMSKTGNKGLPENIDLFQSKK